MNARLPEVKHIYLSRSLDSRRWGKYSPRDDDIIIATPIKSGTTWMQNIIMHLIFQTLEMRPVNDFSPWIDSRFGVLDEIITLLESQQHRRFIKTHLPLDGLPFFPQVKYIVVNRDLRDVFMSLWNHYGNLTPETLARLNNMSEVSGEPFPPCPQDIHDFWGSWITRGTFAWESEGYPYWSTLRHAQTWWEFRHLPNILHVHFNDLLQDLEGEIRRIISYIELDVSEGLLPEIVNAVTFESMKQNAEKIMPGIRRSIEGGAQTFFNKGTNGRWRAVLNGSDLKLYEAAVKRELTADCAHWLENGRLRAG